MVSRQKISDFLGKKAFTSKPTKKDPDALHKLGRVRMAVFSPEGVKLVGFLVKQPDIVGMIRRPDVFVLREAFVPCEGGFEIKDPASSTDDAARKKAQLNWDKCIMWAGMEAKTQSGKELGYIDDAIINAETGAVIAFCVGDGGVAQSLVGHLEIPSGLLVKYERGYMVVEDSVSALELSGGLAGKAGAGYAKAKASGARAAKKADAAAAQALDSGSKALGKQLGKTRGMFGAFVDEYKKASKDD